MYADKFNTYDPPKPVSYVAGHVLELIERAEPHTYAVEEFIHSKTGASFVKHNNNTGGVLTERNTPQAFSHFSYEASERQLIVVDVQGKPASSNPRCRGPLHRPTDPRHQRAALRRG